MTRRAERPPSTRAATAIGLALSVAVALAGCGAVPASVANQAPPSAAATDAPDGDPSTPAEPGTGDATPGEESTPQPPAPKPVSFRTNVTDGDGAGRSNVRVDTLVNVKAGNGTLQSVTLSYVGSTRQGKEVRGTVAGAIDAAKTSWTAKERLEPSATYTLTVNGRGAAGAETEKSSFKTARLSADQETFASISPQTDDPVGIGMPVVLTFDVAVKDRKTFERNLHVQSSPAQEGSWSWLSDTQVRYRPKTWWKPGTTVKAWADINGLPAGNGVFGQKNVSTAFTVSKTSLMVRVNLKSHQAKVYIDDKLRRTIPISAGKSGWETRSGTKLIMGKRPLVRMTGTSIGIRDGSPESFDLDVRWAMQITASGEYMHAAPWNGSRFGRSNGSHGCVGMSTANAKWLYDKVRPGDPTITTGSRKALYQGNGYAEWNISYNEFTKGSAL